MKACAFAVLALVAVASAQPFLPGQNLLPAGNLRTTDGSGPNDGSFNLTLLTTQENQLKAAIAARGTYTDMDILEFLTNVECLEGLFDTYGTFGRGFNGDLEMGGPIPLGAQKANLSYEVQAHMEEVALNEQGHALFTRAAGSTIPCPAIDFVGGFNQFLAAAYGLDEGTTVEDKFGSAFDPFMNDQNYVLCVLTLEELGATGNLGLSQIALNPVIAGGIGGLATSATAQATVERMMLWGLRNETIAPFGETTQQVFARISALRDSLDGPQFDDQGLVNTDPRTIAVPSNAVNMIPTDIHGLTFARTPQMNINILTLGSPNGTGVFFPEGLNGNLRLPTGYAAMASGVADFPANPMLGSQESTADLGTISDPITASGPSMVPGETVLTQNLNGALATASANSHGLDLSAPVSGTPNVNEGLTIDTGSNDVNSGSTATGGR